MRLKTILKFWLSVYDFRSEFSGKYNWLFMDRFLKVYPVKERSLIKDYPELSIMFTQ